MRTNTPNRTAAVTTHGGAPAFAHINPEQQLRRLVMACLLFEKQFYLNGQDSADAITEAARQVTPEVLAKIAIEARTVMKLRHVPLLLTVLLAERGGPIVGETIDAVIQRADELAEFLSLYWRNGKRPLSAQVKKGLARAFGRFSPYQLAKYNRDNAVKLRDVLFLVHAKPKDEKQAETWKALVDGKLAPADTWETRLSGGADKAVTFDTMIREGTLGYLALLRNLRNMAQAGVDSVVVNEAIVSRKNGADKVLPFRYIAAARAAPMYEPALDKAMHAAIAELPAFDGQTAILVDVSGSMDERLSHNGDLTRMDAAAALAAMFNGEARIFTFSTSVVEVPHRKGMAGVDCIISSQSHGGTALAAAVEAINRNVPHTRLIVITDEQATDGRVPAPVVDKAYMVNVGAYKNGVGYGAWTHIDGFSEGILRWIAEVEQT